MNILIAMETSGVTREAFKEFSKQNRYSWNIYSCDLLPADDNTTDHIVGDAFQVIKFLDKNWDLILAHPPCTALAVSGNAWYGKNMPKHSERLEAIEWTTKLWNFIKDHSRFAIMENPVGVLPFKPAQYIQPYEFGHPESKQTM
jgi:site-specific DNA-cytosine methylase